MIPEALEEMFFLEREKLIVPASDVAVLRTDHHLYHAILVLSKSYLTLPVLDSEDRVKGYITMADIVKASTTITGYDFDQLQDKKVSDVMREDVPCIRYDGNLETILKELQDANFICVVDNDDRFCGIITRREVMSRVSRCFHGLNRKYEFVPKGRGNFDREKPEPAQTTFSRKLTF